MDKVIIFDFDGTIADTFILIKSILTDLSEEFGYRVPTDAEIIRLKTMHPLEAMKVVGLSPIKLPFLLKKLNSEIKKQIKDVKPITGMKKALLELHSAKYPLGIVTSAAVENVHSFLKNNDLEIFDFIQSGNNFFGKARVLNGVLKKHKIEKNNALYVGDEIRDVEAAKKVGIPIISVAWGFNEKESLQKFDPDSLIDKPNQLFDAIKNLD